MPAEGRFAGNADGELCVLCMEQAVTLLEAAEKSAVNPERRKSLRRLAAFWLTLSKTFFERCASQKIFELIFPETPSK